MNNLIDAVESQVRPIKEPVSVAEVAEKMKAIFARMESRANEAKRTVEAAKADDETPCCPRHHKPMLVDEPASIRETMRNGELVIVREPCETCQQDKLEARIMMAQSERGVPDILLPATFDNFQARSRTEREAIQAARAWVKNAVGSFVLIGEVGVGKSHLAASILREYGRGLFVTHRELIRDIRGRYHPQKRDTSKPLFEQAMDSDMLVWDDFAAGMHTAKDEEHMVTDLLTERYNTGAPMVLTTNLDSTMLRDAMGLRNYDRLRQSAAAFMTLQGESQRVKRRDAYFAAQD